MAIFDPKSLRAEEFINDEEIRETIAYAEANKHNIELINSLLEKAAPKRSGNGVTCAGLTHREASVLLACDIPEVTERMYKLANDIKLAFYGNRIVMFAPLYLSNYCVNGCVYCPYHLKNKHIARIKLTQEQVRREVIALQDMGHKRLALEAGEHPTLNSLEYILESIRTIYSIRHKNGAIRRVNVNIAATTVENYRRLKDAGIGTPATRAAIIETLFAREYVRREKKSLVPTDKGLAVYAVVRDKKIADVEMTGMWETALAKIEAGSMDADMFRKGIEVYAAQITAELLSVQLSIANGETCSCPKCNNGRILFYPKVAKCSNVDCTLTIFRNKCDKQLSDKQIVELATKRKTGLIKGFKGKNGKAFDASLVLDVTVQCRFLIPRKESETEEIAYLCH